MITTSKWLGLLAAAFAAGSFFASPLPQAIAAVIASDVICNGCVGTSDLAGNAVTSAKIKDAEVKRADIGGGAVTSAKIASGAVANSDIAANAVTGNKIADGTIEYGDLSRFLIAVEHRDDCNCGGTGWDPSGRFQDEAIYDYRIKPTSVVVIAMIGTGIYDSCSTLAGFDGRALVVCDHNIDEGVGVNYAIFNNPAYG